MITPRKLKKGSHVRIISPARSLAIIGNDRIDHAKKVLESLGLSISFGKHAFEQDSLNSSSAESRAFDLHDAFRDKTVDAILTTLGGYNTNGILKLIDYELIQNNPKILCGYSDITVLSNAIYKKTKLITYSGPHFSTFSMAKGLEYCKEYFYKCLFESRPFDLSSSMQWSEDDWYLDQDNRVFRENNGPILLRKIESNVTGTILGGNLSSLALLQGTEFWPSMKGSVLFIEADQEMSSSYFDRQLQSVLHQKDAKSIQALLIGRFHRKSSIDEETLKHILTTKKELDSIPVIYNLDFGHTYPMFTFPIGGVIKVSIVNEKIYLKILNH